MAAPDLGSSLFNPSRSERRQLILWAIGISFCVAVSLVYWPNDVFSKGYLPHAYCYLKKPGLVWTHVISDTLIGLSYLSISTALAYFIYRGRRDVPFLWIILQFGLFIVACGGTHFMEVLTVWIPMYVLAAGVKSFTAFASVATAISLPAAIPRALGMIRSAKASESNRLALEHALYQRDTMQVALERTNDHLDQQVRFRTAELETANEALRNQVEEGKRLRASLAAVASIVQSSNDAIIGKDLDGIITTWNDGAERLYGYTAQEVVGKPIAILAPLERQHELEAIMSRVAQGVRVEPYETQRVTKHGELIDISLTISPMKEASGTIVGASAIARDITQFKRAQTALVESETQYRLLFESNPLPMWVFERETLQFLAVNEAAVQHYGYSRAEFFRMSIADIRRAEDVADLLEEIARLKPGFHDRKIWKHQKKDGTLIDVEITGHDINFHGADAQLVLVHDITERQRSDEQLRQSQERFSKAFRSSPIGIAISSEANGRYLDANPSFLTLLGYERDELLGRTVEELEIWEEPQQRSLLFSQLNSSKPTKRVEASFRTRSGDMRRVEIAAERIMVNDEPCILAITQDVTESKLLEQQFRQSQKMEAVGRLAGGIAHDFNNMLGVIVGYSEIAREQLPADSPTQKHLQEIRKAADRATDLTRQLLAFSRQQVLAPRALNLNTVVYHVSKMLRAMIGEDISLILRPTEPLGSVRADLGQIEQVLMNLAVNARDAMPKGGTIVIETANTDLEADSIQPQQAVIPGPYVVISMTDTGVGMDESTKARLFEPFFTTKEPGKGTGLGLSTVYGIVKQSGGYIFVKSEPELGATFTIYLPRVDQLPESLVSNTVQAVRPKGTETVLVVEDEDALRNLVTSVLEMNGYRVIAADGAASALPLIEQFEYTIDLILTDIILPGTSGPEMVKTLKGKWPKLKVLYMSGYVGTAMLQRGVDQDMALLAKPFSISKLLGRLREVLGE